MSNAFSNLAQNPFSETRANVPYMETFKQRMKRIRVRAGYRSQGEAADAIGCERGTVSMWEAPSSNVKKVSSDLLFDTARAYKVRPDWINDLRSNDDGYPWPPRRIDEDHTPRSEEGESQSAQLDPEILAAAIKLIRLTFEALGVEHNQEDDAEPTALAYAYLLKRSNKTLSGENVVDFMKALRARRKGVEQYAGPGTGGIGSGHRTKGSKRAG